jgi:hypothetical protein
MSAEAASPRATAPVGGNAPTVQAAETLPKALSPVFSRAIWLLVACGLGVRLQQYLHNRSLWLDEAMMALNVLHRSFHQLTEKLTYSLVAPIGWLWLEKLCQLVLGKGELALRLVSVLASAAALLLTAWLAAQVLNRRAQVLAVALVAFHPSLIYYATELKPYATDVAVAVLLWCATFWVLRRAAAARLIVFALAGVLAVWLSHPAVFVLAGIGVTLTAHFAARGAWRRLAAMLAVFSAWGISFIAEYVLALRQSSSNPGLLNTYPFVHFPPRHFANLDEVVRTAFAWQQEPWALALSGVVLFAFLVGAWQMLQRQRLALWLLASPVLVALLASALHHYPVLLRFMLFATPAVLVVAAAGVEAIRQSAAGSAVSAGGILLFLLLLQPLFTTAEYVVRPIEAEEFKAALKYTLAHRHDGDVFYIYCYARHHFEYYQELYGLSGLTVVQGSCFRAGMKNHAFVRNWNFLRDDFSKLQGQKRVWLLFTHDAPVDGLDEKAYALRFLNEEGRLLDAHYENGATAFLYDLNQPPSAAPAR